MPSIRRPVIHQQASATTTSTPASNDCSRAIRVGGQALPSVAINSMLSGQDAALVSGASNAARGRTRASGFERHRRDDRDKPRDQDGPLVPPQKPSSVSITRCNSPPPRRRERSGRDSCVHPPTDRHKQGSAERQQQNSRRQEERDRVAALL